MLEKVIKDKNQRLKQANPCSLCLGVYKNWDEVGKTGSFFKQCIKSFHYHLHLQPKESILFFYFYFFWSQLCDFGQVT